MKDFKVGDKVKYINNFGRPAVDTDDGIENKYTILAVEPSGGYGYIYDDPNPRGVSGATFTDRKTGLRYTWGVRPEEVELIEEEIISLEIEYEEPEEDEFDENCVEDCKPSDHKCGK